MVARVDRAISMLVYDASLRMKKGRPRMRGIESPPQNVSLTVTPTGLSGNA